VTDHPITPPAKLILKWTSSLNGYAQAARWGADQELEACCEWLTNEGLDRFPMQGMREARRPKPPSLKEQALGALYAIATGADDTREFYQDLETIKQALESLPS
jgi:hypothetical protein